jgi:SAM-dependent methyltransferase
MKESDINEYINRYTERFNEFGFSPETLGWGKNSKQTIRFGVLSEYALKYKKSSVLDIGCGFADLYLFLKTNGWEGKYTGTDLVPVLLEKARELYPEIDLLQIDIEDEELKSADYVIASGIFNAKISEESNESHIEKSLELMFKLCNKALCVDFMSTYVDFQKDAAWHTSPEWAFNIAKKLSKRIILRNDYMPYEFSLIIFKDDTIENSVFQNLNK